MVRPKYLADASPVRVAPGTAVTWFESMRQHTGRVLHNLPGPKGRPGTVVVKAMDGRKVVLPLRRVSIVGGDA